MNPKQIIIAGTIAIVISISTVFQNEEANASLGLPGQADSVHTRDSSRPEIGASLQHVLGGLSDEEIHDALYNGRTLADLAEEQRVDVEDVIDLQVAELSQQLTSRLTSGSITAEQYETHQAELREMITKSVHGLSG
ncbi:hypothetical protein [Paenibacillus oceani]|uniref:SHOCT domain-containing protein n=1 Tax=Paenibacillus oceani TaxID=2772510 RepID=A0A927CAR5_9BACL|nr:hypothetical protein [Paenibacillus oceani]MBD2864584.1 hypothetical protein [Paenibacillus oceani]